MSSRNPDDLLIQHDEHDRPFPPDGVCTNCGDLVRYCELVPSVREIDIDEDGTVWVSMDSEEITEAAESHRFECGGCLREYSAPSSWGWGS